MTNLNLLFHKIYYDKIGTNDFESAVKISNQRIFEATFVNAEDFLPCEIPGVKSVRMKTKYPGLLIGTGYPHGSGRADDDIKYGFSFDYVSGQPYIPGSSVKGVLRSHFKDHSDAIVEIVEELTSAEKIPMKTVKELEANIFDCGDTFLDAVLYDGNERNRVLGNEYLTPHAEVTKSPNPIHIMKVLPDVRFEFRFLVSDFVKDGFTFKGEQKKELFKILLELFGIGAKTNVGYGILVSDDSAPRARVQQENTQNNHGNVGNNGGNGNRSNNYGNSNRSNNYGNSNRSNNYGNADAARQEKVKCPNPDCNYMHFKYHRDGITKHTQCKKCGTNLP